MNRDELWNLIDAYALATLMNRPITVHVEKINEALTEWRVER